jgi:transposase
MAHPQASRDIRERALAALDAGWSVADVAAFCQNDPSTVRRWRRQRARTGSGLPRPRSGRPPLIPPSAYPALEAQVTARPDATLADHCAFWATTHGVRPCVSTMSRLLRHLGLTLKKRP